MRAQRTHRALARIARVSQRQHGSFSAQQLYDSGLTVHQVKHRVRTGEWIVLDTNVYGPSTTTASWKQRLVAACLAGPAVASHRSAGILWNFPSMPEEFVEVTALRHRRRRSPDVVWHESFHLSERDVTELDGIPVTRPVRTFLDLAVVVDPKVLEHVLNDGMHRNLLSIPAIWRRWEQLGPLRHGAGKVRDLLESYTADERPTESLLETLYFQLLREGAVPTPTKQLVVPGIGRIDFAYPDFMVSIELDGGRFHSSREAQERDRAKSNDLVAAGWRVLRFTWDDVTKHPDRVLALMRSLGAQCAPSERIYRVVLPPLRWRVWPVIQAASSEAR